MRLQLLILLLMFGYPVCSVAQVAQTISVRHIISSRHGGIDDASIATDETIGICVARSLGILRSTDRYRHLQAVQTPEQASYFADFYGCALIYPGCFVSAGTYLDQVSRRTVLSYDGGLTWEQNPTLANQGVGGVESFQFTGGAYGRLNMYFTRDSARNFTYIYFPDTIPWQHDFSRIRYIGAGRFVVRNDQSNQWYEIDIENARFVKSELPSELNTVYQTTDGSLVGLEQRGPRSVFRRQTAPDTTFDEIVYRGATGQLLDSIWVNNSIEQISGGALLCRLGLSNNKLLAITGEDAWEIPLDGHIPGATKWGAIRCSHENSFLITLSGSNGTTLGMVLVDVTNQSVRVLPSHQLTSYNFDMLTDSLMIDFNRGSGTIVRYDLATEQVELIGTVSDSYDRQQFIAIDKAVVCADRPLFLDFNGDVFEVDSSSRCLLLRQGATGRMGWIENHYSATMPSGTNLIWPDANTVVTGGKQMQRIAPDGATMQLRRDSTSSWLRTSWGDEFAGHRTLARRNSDSAPYDTVGVPWSQSVVIGHLVECNDESLLAGLRGFRREKNGFPADTVHGGLWQSHDHGSTWSKITLPVVGQMILSLERRTTDGSLWATVTDAYRSSSTETDSNGVEEEVSYAANINNLHLIRSTDNGATWTLVSTQSIRASWRANISNAAFYGENNVAWAAWNHVYWSDDNGATWRLVEGLPFGTLVVSHVMFDTHGNLWISTNEGIYQVPASQVSVINDPGMATTPIFWAETFPNPSGPNTTLRLHNLDRLKGEIATLKIVDIVGRTVLDLRQYTQSARPSGIVDIPIDLGTDAHGVYMLVAQAHDRSFTWPMCVVKE